MVPAPGPVPPVPARSCCRHLSFSKPSRFSHLLRPPTGASDGVTLGVCDGVTLGVCDGVTLGVCDGVTLGVCDGVTLGVYEGVTLGVLDPVDWAKATLAIASSAAAVTMLRNFIRASFMDLLQLQQAACRAAGGAANGRAWPRAFHAWADA